MFNSRSKGAATSNLTVPSIGNQFGTSQDDSRKPLMDNLTYYSSWRFLPPNMHNFWGNTLRFMVVEFVVTLLILYPVYLQAAVGGIDAWSRSSTCGLLALILILGYWNWGKPTGNLGLTLTYFGAGIVNGWQVLTAIFTQGLASIVAIYIVHGFTGKDPTPAVFASTNTLSWEKQFGFAFFNATILFSFVLWTTGGLRLFFEAFSKFINRNPQLKESWWWTMGEGLDARGQALTRDVPADIQVPHLSRISTNTALVYASGVIVIGLSELFYNGSLLLGNFWYWFPSVFPTAATPVPGAIPMGTQFVIGFVATTVMAPIAAIALFAAAGIFWVRYGSLQWDKFTEEDKNLYDYGV